VNDSSVFLLARTSALLIAEPSREARRLVGKDIDGLAQLFADATMGTTNVADAREYIDELALGKHGEPWPQAWLGIYEGGSVPVAAIVCTRRSGVPCIAHIATAPGSRGRGYASSLIRAVAVIADAAGDTAVGGVVERNSSSMRLYLELGFDEITVPAGLLI
jgi:predicted GNAT family acetyltransferase